MYNHLANFFARYYNEGDFMSLRRYSGGSQPTYLIPYDGEEVKLHWANADQYYVKTTENYSSYVFTVGAGTEARRVRFEIAAADNEKDNVKETSGKQRRFLLAGDDAEAVTFDGADLVVRFAHRPLTDREKKTFPGTRSKQQDRINEAIYYMIKWLWSNFLKLRSYLREGFINELRNRNPQEIDEDWHFREGYVEGSKSQGLEVEDTDIINDKDFRGLVTDLVRSSLVSRAVTFMELFGVSFVFPLLIAFVALVALLIRFL